MLIAGILYQQYAAGTMTMYQLDNLWTITDKMPKSIKIKTSQLNSSLQEALMHTFCNKW